MSDDVSGVVIGTDGRCDRCLDAIARRPHEYWPGPQGAVRMARLVARLRREGRRSAYDAVVGLSGGIDSAYLAHVMATKHDLRLLAVHVDGGWNSEPAVHNIEKIVRGTKMDLVTSVIEWDEMRDLQRAFLRAGVYNQDFPQDHAFFSTLIAVAQHYGVKTFLSGVNFATESVSVPHGGPSSIDGKHLAAIHKQFGTGVLRSYPVTTAYDYLYATRIRGYPRRARPLDFIDYNKEKARRELALTYGWRDYGEKHSESRFTKFYQDVYLPRKVGEDKRRLHLSALIVSDQISRNAALEVLAQPIIAPRQEERELDYVAKKLQMTASELRTILATPTISHSAYPSDHLSWTRLTNARRMLRRFTRVASGNV